MAVIVRYSAPGDIVTLRNSAAKPCSPLDREVSISEDATTCIWRHPIDHTWIAVECSGWGEHSEDEWRDSLATELDLTPALLRCIQARRDRGIAEFSQSSRLPGYREALLNSIGDSLAEHP